MVFASALLNLKVTIRRIAETTTFKAISGLFKLARATRATTKRKTIKLINILTRFGKIGFKKIIIKGSVIKIAIAVDAIRVVETTIEIDFINSPIIPVEIRRGRNAQTAVMVEDQIGTTKSLRTKSPV